MISFLFLVFITGSLHGRFILKNDQLLHAVAVSSCLVQSALYCLVQLSQKQIKTYFKQLRKGVTV